MEALSLVEALATVPDPRDPRGVRHPLTAILSLTVVAILGGMKSLAAISQFGRDRGPAFAHALGFRRGKAPAKSCLSDLFGALDAEALEAVLARWLQSRVEGGWQAVAVDGKTLKGSADGEAPGVHLLSAFIPSAASVLGQMRVDAKTNEHKAALKLLGVLPIEGKVVTGDAMFTHRDVAQEIRDKGGDYILMVKDNQPELKAAIQSALHGDADFSPYQRRRKEADERTARTVDKGHGRIEHRRLTSTTMLNGYLDWPGVGQVFELERVRRIGGKEEVEVAYGITSLSRQGASAEDLLGLVRGHWGIENKLHYVRDEALGEDRCRVRKGAAAQALAALRNVAVYLLGKINPRNKAAATRRVAANPGEAIDLLHS